MKRREPIMIYMAILAALFDGPRVPTQLAQACNVNFARIGEFLRTLEERGLIRSSFREGHDVYAITDDGFRLYHDWLKVWSRLPLD